MEHMTEVGMKEHSTQEIINKVQAIFNAEHAKNYFMGWKSEGCVSVEKNTQKEVKVTISCMYEAPPSPTLDVLMQLAEFFGTKNINDDDKFANGGCETCDYGSSYGYTLTVRPESSNAKVTGSPASSASPRGLPG
jgi:hypothetical protein